MLVFVIGRIAALSVTEISLMKCCLQGLTLLSAGLDSVYLYWISNTRLYVLTEQVKWSVGSQPKSNCLTLSEAETAENTFWSC